ncbi:Zn(2+)-responsive transcriptional regulator [Marinomonas primoryensis]|jgi:MerR family Zn(II)-responsive transcriptional regulator of zntA|uniref:Heavy metal-responsive transcriptional regulator n=2 Tax=Marinomonas primoryensis TaxID=178399 RepID=A0A859CYW2_9GAMM|nr:Zn(2+)-responsive transcriptional regulator [Marinomonas primoryensis]QKK79680.1 heavy metal-responsive transcriptional regulator [Marinomonas primoryensis]|tara:strand:+ start:13057 stop:13503 length:447 start_codon:yes stop_codon:yes gene_type:complete
MYRIGELARICNINSDTLRFYEKNALLTPSSRSESGYRLYTEKDKDTLQFILRAKGVGFTLADIRELLSIEVNKADNACADVKVLVDTKRYDVEKKIAELIRFQTSLKRLSDACCGGAESAEHCTILEALESNTDDVRHEHHHNEVTE